MKIEYILHKHDRQGAPLRDVYFINIYEDGVFVEEYVFGSRSKKNGISIKDHIDI